MRGRTGLIGLKGETAQAGGITGAAHRQGGLPSAQKKVLGGEAMVVRGTLHEVFGKVSSPMALTEAFDGRHEPSVIVVAGIPPVTVLDSETRGPVSLVPEPHRRVPPHGKHIGFPSVVGGRKMGAYMTRFQEGGHGKAPHPGASAFHGMNGPVLPGVWIQPDGRAARNEEELAEFRYGDEVGRDQGGRSVRGESGHPEMRVIKDPALAVGVEHEGEFSEIHTSDVYIEAPGKSKDFG
jgi:hypothetical protein